MRIALALPMLAFSMLITVVPRPIVAADQTILGSSLLLKDPSTPNKRSVSAKAKEVGSDNTIVGDPTVTGASLTITADGASPTQETYNLPIGLSAVSGKPFWTG